MATYKWVCVHCNNFIDHDSRFCPLCGSHSPFGYVCPTCLRPIERGTRLCAGCGRALYVTCPSCGRPTFVKDQCERCGASLMRPCQNKRCGVLQFFENTKCTACGKHIKN